MVDSHCHIAGPEFTADLPAVVDRARAAGVDRALVIVAADDGDERGRVREVEAAWPEIRCAIGVHPHNAGSYSADTSSVARVVLDALEREPLARGVGEIGLDYHYDFAPREVQQCVFREQIRVARQRRLPIVVHTREADDDTVRILREESAGDVGGVLHCFTGTLTLARAALDVGFHISLSGIVSFPKASDLRDVARLVPLERLLVETDSPFLAPVPYRGKRNEPAWVRRVGEVVADARGLSLHALEEVTTRNFERLFTP